MRVESQAVDGVGVLGHGDENVLRKLLTRSSALSNGRSTRLRTYIEQGAIHISRYVVIRLGFRLVNTEPLLDSPGRDGRHVVPTQL